MYSKIKQFLDAAPTALKSANEIYNFARNAYKQAMGFFPDGIDDIFLKRGAAEMQDVRNKVVNFPEGGKDKTDFFSTRPDPRVKQPEGAKMDVQRAHENLSGGSNYAQGDTKYNADVLADEIARSRKLIPDDGIADSSDLDFKTKTALYDEAYSYLTSLRFLNKPPKKEGIKSIDLAKELERLTNENLKKRGLGDIKLGDNLPPPKNKKPDVDPVLQQSEDQKQMFLDFGKRTETDAEIIARMNKQNKDSVQRLKDKKEIEKSLQQLKDSKKPQKTLKDLLDEYDGDPDAMAMGGRIGMSKGGGIINFIKSLLKKKKSPSEDFADYLKEMREKSDRMNKEFYKGLEEGGELDQNVAKIKEGYKFPDRSEIKKQIKERVDKKRLEKFDVEGRKPNAMGGRIGFDKGSPPSKGRRNFLKLLGGLASIPVFGKLFKAAKPAAKVAEVAKEVTSGVPAYFPKLVEKIKMLGNDVTEKAATVERQKVIDYKDYTLTEDITTGAITIDKRTEGGGMYQIGEQMEYESGIVKQERIEYTPPETIMGKDGKPVKIPAQYEEVTVKPDFEGKMKDVESGLDSYDEILEEVGESKIKKSGGGLAYMMGE